MHRTNASTPLGQADRDVLRELADNGNEAALDRLADLADERADVDELHELLDEEGCERAGQHLTRRAIEGRDLLELHRLADAGSEDAEAALERFLRKP